MTSYQNAIVDDSKIFYREAGSKTPPTILLLHGFPTSSHMFRNLIPALADRYRVIAPDLPGFGFSDAPDRRQFRYTFENLAKIIDSFTQSIGIGRYAIYVFDYGAPVGLRLALAHPERITAIISQNGNAYEEGLSQGWNPIQKYWKEPTPENRAALCDFPKPEATKAQYLLASRMWRCWRRKLTNSTPRSWPGPAITRSSLTCFWIMPAMSRSIPSSRNISALSSRRCWRFGARVIRSFFLPAQKRSRATTRTQRCISSKRATLPWKRMPKKLRMPFANFSVEKSTSQAGGKNDGGKDFFSQAGPYNPLRRPLGSPYGRGT